MPCGGPKYGLYWASDNKIYCDTGSLKSSVADTQSGTVICTTTRNDATGAGIVNVNQVEKINDTTGTQTYFVDKILEGPNNVEHVGQLCEILIYDSVLSAGDISDVEDYLAAKWGVTL